MVKPDGCVKIKSEFVDSDSCCLLQVLNQKAVCHRFLQRLRVSVLLLEVQEATAVV